MISEEQYQTKKMRILKTLELFIENEGRISDKDLATAVNLAGIKTSSSSVGRDLSENLEKLFKEENERKQAMGQSISTELTEEQASVLAFVRKKRKDNKLEGNSKGGSTSVKLNDVQKDKLGKFNGCKRRI